MKEGITSLDIEPFLDYVDFIGPANDPVTADETQTLKGNLRLVLTKPIKIRAMSVKFIGESTIYKTLDQNEIVTPILPKLKSKLNNQKTSSLPAGEHLLRWDLEIPNIYPMSFSNRKCSISYKVEIKISIGINKSISATRDITIKRHLLPSQQLAPLVSTKAFEHTIPNSFYYRVEVPKVVCLEQGYFPISIKYDLLDRTKKNLVQSITTQISQIEVYRNRVISKTEADMANVSSQKKNAILFGQSLADVQRSGDTGLLKLISNVTPTTHTLDRVIEDCSTVPLLLRQELSSSLYHGFESPLVAIYHQLEILFKFNQQEEIRAKIPILVSPVPDETVQPFSSRQKYTMETVLHNFPLSVEYSTQGSVKKADGYRSTMDESAMSQIKKDGISTTSLCENLKRSVSVQDVKKSKPCTPPQSIFPSCSQTSSNMFNSGIVVGSSDSEIRLGDYADSTSSLSSSPASSNETPYSSLKSSCSEKTSHSSSFNGTGLHPPPRQGRKKEPGLILSSEPGSPISQPTSPITPNTPRFRTYAPFQSNLMSQKFLIQSKSSTTGSPALTAFVKKRSNSIDDIPYSPRTPAFFDEKYAPSITNHYGTAELPPIPKPDFTRQKLPEIPADHRRTRMYYEDESDEEDELEAYDTLFVN